MDDVTFESDQLADQICSETFECGDSAYELPVQDFARVALSHQAVLLRTARRLTRDRLLAEDLVQETYLRALQARRSFQLRQFGMRPWLLRILRNLYLTQRANQARRRAALPESGVDVEPCARRSGSAATDFDHMDEELVQAIGELPRSHRSVLFLWAIDGLTYHEVAAAVHSPPGTIMSRLHRARGRLSRRLARFAAENRLRRKR